MPEATNRFGMAQSPVSAQTIDQVFGVDARAAALLIAEFARRHVARGGDWGRIIGLTSGEANGFPEEISYGAAKAAQVNFTLSAATELARFGVTANVVHPPMTDTGWISQRTAAWAQSAGHRVATPRQVADVIAYLASDAARSRHGQRHPAALTEAAAGPLLQTAASTSDPTRNGPGNRPLWHSRYAMSGKAVPFSPVQHRSFAIRVTSSI